MDNHKEFWVKLHNAVVSVLGEASNERFKLLIPQWPALPPVELAGEDYELALEVAECAGLLKGYGDTHVSGSRKFEAVMEAVGKLRGRADAAGIIKQMREAN